MKRLLVTALFAGLAGGFAEIAWITLYSSIAPTSGVEVARQVALTVWAPSADAPWASWAGAGIHLALSLALSIAFVLVLWGASPFRPSPSKIFAAALLALACIWAANFLLILPHINPAFVTLMPYAVTFVSKASFGLAMAWVLVKSGPDVARAPKSVSTAC